MRIPIDKALAGQRLDKVVAGIAGLGRARARALFEEGRVYQITDERRHHVGKGMRAVEGTELEIDVTADELSEDALPDDELAATLVMALERADLVIVDKAAGIPTAPIRRGERGTLANALVSRYPEMASVGMSRREPGLCHRLDTGTSGLLLAARTAPAFDALVAALRSGKLDKRYLAVCEGSLDDEGEIDVPLANDPRDPRRVLCYPEEEDAFMAVRVARTTWRVVERAGSRVLIEARAARAHRHQIRAHMAHLGAPLAGDVLYGAAPLGDEGRHALHASHLAWSGSKVVAAFQVTSPLPSDLRALLA